MESIYEELQVLESDIQAFPSESHWFCPKVRDDDYTNYQDLENDDDDVSIATKRHRDIEAQKRQKQAYQFIRVYGLPEDEQVSTWKAWYTKRLTHLLTTCDKCVKGYHMGRAGFLELLAIQYDEDTVLQMSDIINKCDFGRIEGGLERANQILIGLPESRRSLSGLGAEDPTALQALYEALCCKAFHSFKSSSPIVFDSVFRLIQTNKTLVLGDLVPATTSFLFDADPYRQGFARKGWTGSRTNQNITDSLFIWVIRDGLLDAMRTISQQGLAVSDVQRFWSGALLIIDKLDEELIVHSLRALESTPDIYHLALECLHSDSAEVLDSVIQVIHLLIQKSSKSLWDAYGSISPSVVAEQIFSSRGFLPLLLQNSPRHPGGIDACHALLWIPDFIRSLGPNQQFEACRTILSALLVKLQDPNVVIESARFKCFGGGLGALAMTLETFVSPEYRISASTSFITINNILGLVDHYKDIIIRCAVLNHNVNNNTEISRLGLDVIRMSIYLDCKAFRAQFVTISSGEAIHHGLDSHSSSLWLSVLEAFKPDDMAMARVILAGIEPLNGVDHFKAYKKDAGRNLLPLGKNEQRFEKDFGPMSTMVSRIYAHLSEFAPDNLKTLCQDPKTATQIFAGLTPADKTTYEWAVDIIKTVTGEETRRDAISKLLRDSLQPTLTAMYKAVSSAASLKTYAAFPHILKTGGDTLESLCDAQDGLLRTASLSTGEKNVLKIWWRIQWRTLETAFKMTEHWSQAISSVIMTNFVRDTMDFAEALFDNYSVLASALENPDNDPTFSDKGTGSSDELCRYLLEQPRRTMADIAAWLRLRDSYLVSTSTSLVSKILRRLGEFDMEIDDQAKDFIQRTLLHEVKTVLTGQQKAELRRALNEHFGVEEIEDLSKVQHIKAKSRNGVIDLESWSRSAGQTRPSSTDSGDDRSLTPTLDKHQSLLSTFRSRHAAVPPMKANKGISIKESREKERKAKAARDAAMVAKARALRGESAIVAGEGSALMSLGVTGKDHAPQRSEIMVSSDSESESDDDDDTPTSLILGKKKELRRGMLDPRIQVQEGPVKKTKIIRSAKDMRARLTPPMEPLHQVILDWEIFHDGDEPPNALVCQKVASKFRTTTEYSATFMPLLVSEAWRSFKTAKEEHSDSRPFEIKIANRMSVDRFFEVSTSVSMSIGREHGLSEGDIILLSKGRSPMADRDAPHCLARIDRIARKKAVWEISYRVSGNLSDRKSLLASFAPNMAVFGEKVTSMTTIEREYGALHSMQYYDLCEEVLSAKPSPLLRYTDQDIERMRSRYEVNHGQAKAILSVRDNDGFTLIQGPPGSGKTKTIVAMIGALLTGSFEQNGIAISRPLPGVPSASKPTQKKLLVCAPSNAAVDELVMRLKDGVITTKGEHQKINVIRLGRGEAINANVKDVTLDELVRIKLEGDNNGQPTISNREKLHLEAGKLKETLAELRPKLDAARAGSDKSLEMKYQREFEGIKRQQALIGSKIDEDKDSGNTAARDNELRRRMVQQQILDGAHVICSTLSASGHDMFKNLSVEFETVIIDEAAQCIELSALIPLKYGCSKCILVGDPKQLPPTVLSRAAASFGYEQSLFVRMQKNHPDSVHLLDTQYRMHPEISSFPSLQFYDGKLVDGVGMATLRSQPWHASSLLSPYRFFDVKGTQSNGSGGHSFINIKEIQVAMQIYERVTTDFPQIDFRRKIGVITPYKAQLRELKSSFSRKYGEDIIEQIDFNTTDSFQGREAEIIIFSCVRARATGGIGFMNDIRRMNVGLTRAKSSLWVLGDSTALLQGEFWAKLVNDAKQRTTYTDGDVLSLLRRPVSKAELKAFSTQKPSEATMLKIEKETGSAISNLPLSPMEDVVYTLSKAELPTNNHNEASGVDNSNRKCVDSRNGVERVVPTKVAVKPTRPLSLSERMKRAASTNKSTPYISKGTLQEENEFGKRPADTTLEATSRRASPHLNAPAPDTTRQVTGEQRPNPRPPTVPGGAPKIIKKRPAADPLRRQQRPPR